MNILRTETEPVLLAEVSGPRLDAIKCVGLKMQSIPSFGLTNFEVTTDLLGIRVTGAGAEPFVVIDFDEGNDLLVAKVYIVDSSILRGRLLPHTKQSLLLCNANLR